MSNVCASKMTLQYGPEYQIGKEICYCQLRSQHLELKKSDAFQHTHANSL